MYKKSEATPELPDFALPFEGNLNPENRWIKLAGRLPWHELEADYAKHFKSCGRGEIALNVQIALGGIADQVHAGFKWSRRGGSGDGKPVSAVLSGIKKLQNKPPFDASLMTHFR